MFEHTLNPPPQRWHRLAQRLTLPDRVTVAICGLDNPGDSTLWSILRDDLRHMLKRDVTLANGAGKAVIRLTCRPVDDGQRLLPREGYALHVAADGICVTAEDDAGLFYGAQTLAQLISLSPDLGVQHGEIVDWPVFTHRWFMPDLGRAVFTMPLLRRLVRLCARLKYNGLHLHLHDNEMNPVRYDGLPLGSENPFALDISDYAELIDYARLHHVRIIPEIESWGHCGSILQHHPDLYGATRLHGYGHSLGIGAQSLDLLEQLYDQWLNILPEQCMLHVGLDEANWRLLDGADPAVFHRGSLVELIHDRLQRRAAARGRQVTMLMWGGGVRHADTPVPASLRDRVIMLPWNYHSDEAVREQLMRHWIRDTKRFGEDGALRSPFIAGAGSGGVHEFGAVEATLSWATRGQEFPNCLGMDVTNWASNDIHGRLLNLYFGAAASWSPAGAEQLLRRQMAMDMTAEEGVGRVLGFMRSWQGCCADADPDAINADRGPEVCMGRYRYGDRHGQPVVPIWMPQRMYRGDQDK